MSILKLNNQNQFTHIFFIIVKELRCYRLKKQQKKAIAVSRDQSYRNIAVE